tara:strand:+ start:326 stop:1693 length:1368 start_codon:yes stop_codon:yes gene_type:complete
MNDPEVIDISSLGSSKEIKSTNFGSGIELLMNEKKNTPKSESSDLEVINLENELNNLVVDELPTSSILLNEDRNIEIPKVTFENEPTTVKLGMDTTDSNNDHKTWDGFQQFNEIPVNPDINIPQKNMSQEQLLKEKFNYLRKLEILEKKGVQLTKKYSMDSNLMEMMGEYELIMDEKEKENSIKFQGNMLSALINGIEFLNGKFDPFDFKLDGWGEQFNENVTDYDEIFGELHEKYKSNAKMAPEIKLIFQLAASGMMVHMSNTMFKSSMPNMDDIMRQNPDLMQEFNKAAVSSMGKTNPGFSNFMSGVMNPEPQPPVNQKLPPPVATQEQKLQSRRQQEETEFINRRPDILASKDGVNLRDNNIINQGPEKEIIQKSYKRPEMKGPSTTMKGPSDISNLLDGLKAKTNNPPPKDDDNGSTISISELKELQHEGTLPKKSKRKQKSDKATISLDI